jgi:hypothetical protein
MQCTDCQKTYVGQTGRNFETRFKQLIRDIRNNEPNSKFTQHIFHTTHEYGSIEKIIKPLHIGKKGPLLDSYEKFHIYEIIKQKIQLNDNYNETYNPIYNIIISTYQNM